MAYQPYSSASKTSLSATGPTIAEMYLPLWVYSTSYIEFNSTSAGASTSFVSKGASGSSGTSATSTQSILHTLNSSWNTNQLFAFEASMKTSVNTETTNVALWDLTSGMIVSASQLATTGTNFQVLRSGSFTLTPGHSYGVTVWGPSSAAYYFSINKAHLVALMM